MPAARRRDRCRPAGRTRPGRLRPVRAAFGDRGNRLGGDFPGAANLACRTVGGVQGLQAWRRFCGGRVRPPSPSPSSAHQPGARTWPDGRTRLHHVAILGGGLATVLQHSPSCIRSHSGVRDARRYRSPDLRARAWNRSWSRRSGQRPVRSRITGNTKDRRLPWRFAGRARPDSHARTRSGRPRWPRWPGRGPPTGAPEKVPGHRRLRTAVGGAAGESRKSCARNSMSSRKL